MPTHKLDKTRRLAPHGQPSVETRFIFLSRPLWRNVGKDHIGNTSALQRSGFEELESCERYCQVNWRRMRSDCSWAYCTDEHRCISLPSSSLPYRDH